MPDAPEPFLTLSQAMRLHTRHTLPAIDVLLEALDHAASLDTLPDKHRATLRRTANGIRDVCQPEVPEVLPGRACPRCPPGAGDLAAMGLPHTGGTHQMYHYLLKAGLADCAQIAATPTSVLAVLERIGEGRARIIRAAVPYEGGEEPQ